MKFINKNEIDDIKGFVEFLKKSKKDFTVSQTGYSLTVDFKGQQFMYIDKITGGKCFASYNMIKRDILNSPVVIDNVPRSTVRYYGVNQFIKNRRQLPDEVLNIDINSAYLTVLFNAGIITQPTYEYVMKSGKNNRLKSVGMLATKRNVLTYKNGEMVNHAVITDSHLRNYFFYCCYEVGEIMNKIAGLLEKKFLFFWVDGIYCTPDTDSKQIVDALTERGFTSKVKHLNACNFKTENDNLYFDYIDTDTLKRKTFCLPFENEENNENIRQFVSILTKEQLTRFNSI